MALDDIERRIGDADAHLEPPVPQALVAIGRVCGPAAASIEIG